MEEDQEWDQDKPRKRLFRT